MYIINLKNYYNENISFGYVMSSPLVQLVGCYVHRVCFSIFCVISSGFSFLGEAAATVLTI